MIRQSLLPTLSDHPFFCMPESVGWYYDHPGHSVNRAAGAMNSFSLHLVTGGKGFVEIDNEPIVLQQGDAFLYFPLQEQRYYSSTEDPWNIRWMHFYGPTVKEFLIQKGFHHSPLWTVKQWKPLAQAYHQLLEEAERNKILHVTRLSILSYGVLAQFLNQAIPLTAHKGSNGYDRILRLMPSMQEKACRPFVLEEWAEMAGVTPHYSANCSARRRRWPRSILLRYAACRRPNSCSWRIAR